MRLCGCLFRLPKMLPKSSYTPVESVREDQSESQKAWRSTPKSGNGLWNVDWWWAELLCALLGTALVVALCIVLNRYDGAPSPPCGSAFGSALTLNTIVAILGTSARVALLYLKAECIGQLKWIWFLQETLRAERRGYIRPCQPQDLGRRRCAMVYP